MRTTVTALLNWPNKASRSHTFVAGIRLLLLCIGFCAMLGFVHQAYSQQPPIRLCTPDCSDDGWWPGSPDIVIPLSSDSNCKITVKWWYRSNRCFNPWTFDVQVASASYTVSEGCPPFAMPFSEVLKIAYEEIMRKGYAWSPFEFLEENECYDSYRIVQANCWRTDLVPVFGWSACENNSLTCCMQRYRVCKINGQRKIYRLGTGGTNSTTFPPCQNDFDNAHCENMCAVLAIIGDGDEGPPPGGGGQGSKRQVEPVVPEDRLSASTAVPNPASESVAISFTAQQVGEAVIRLYDATGKEMIKTTSSMSKEGEATVNLDIRHIPNGAYRYDITQGSTVITVGSFVVLKK